jgi:hypothetical protein
VDTGSDDEREIRAARNQSLFRAVNEEIRKVNEKFSEFTETFTIACECADSGCLEMLRIGPEAYEEVRAHPNRFAVLPGHVYPEVERVVQDYPAYVVVEKERVAADVADLLDPRGA